MDVVVKQARLNWQKQLLIVLIIAIMLIAILIILTYKQYTLKQRAALKLMEAYHVLRSKNEMVLDSIHYAKRIQDSILIKEREIHHLIPDSFIYHQAKDIVSGDFYWLAKTDEKLIICTVDSSNHGVPGALIGMLGNTLLNQIVKGMGIYDPERLVTIMNERINKTFAITPDERNGNSINIELKMAVCSIDFNTGEGLFSGINQCLYIVDSKGVKIIYGSSGAENEKFNNRKDQPCETQAFKLTPNTCIYLCSDGFLSQSRNRDHIIMKEEDIESLLKQLYPLEMHAQHFLMQQNFSSWLENEALSDDVLIWGIRYKKAA